MGEEIKKDSLEALMKEFKESGLTIDEFCKKHLERCGIKNPDGVLQTIEGTFTKIDEHYQAIKDGKAAGKSRADYLKGVCAPFLGKTEPENAGKIITRIIQAICGSDKADIEIPYSDDEERADAIVALEAALKGRVIKDNMPDDAKNNEKED